MITIISAVIGLFFDKNGDLLTIENKRGLDVPGGHLEKDEDFMEAIIRETEEEAGTKIKNIQVIGKIKSQFGKYKNRTMIFVTGEIISFDKKIAGLMSVSNFLKKYKQNKSLMKRMLKKAELKYEKK